MLEWLSKESHLPGQKRDDDGAKTKSIVGWLLDTFRQFGLDHVAREEVEAFLSYPDPDCPNKVELFDANNEVVFTTAPLTPGRGDATCSAAAAVAGVQRQGRNIDQWLGEEEWVPPYAAFSPRGDGEGAMVYAHFGRKQVRISPIFPHRNI